MVNLETMWRIINTLSRTTLAPNNHRSVAGAVTTSAASATRVKITITAVSGQGRSRNKNLQPGLKLSAPANGSNQSSASNLEATSVHSLVANKCVPTTVISRSFEKYNTSDTSIEFQNVAPPISCQGPTQTSCQSFTSKTIITKSSRRKLGNTRGSPSKAIRENSAAGRRARDIAGTSRSASYKGASATAATFPSEKNSTGQAYATESPRAAPEAPATSTPSPDSSIADVVFIGNGSRGTFHVPATAAAGDAAEDSTLHGNVTQSGGVLIEPLLALSLISRKERNEYRSKMSNERTRISMLQDGISSIERWLIDQKLVPILEWCPYHRSVLGEPMRMRIHVTSHEIGWRCESCTDLQTVPLMKGSIFEGVFLPPATLLLLVWHWAKLNSPSIVHSDTGVSQRHITLVDRCIRALCTVMLHRQATRLGDSGDIVQVGLTSFPIRDKSGVTRSTREILAALEPRRCLLRMRVYDLPESEEGRATERVRVLQMLPRWIQLGARVAADATIDTRALTEMGFVVCKSSILPDPQTAAIMSYLCQHLPPMYERNGNHIRLAPMQLFLDELSWRERWGPVPFLAYDNILQHIADITQAHFKAPDGVFPKTPRFVDWLLEVVRNPFRDWSCLPDGDLQVISEGPISSDTVSDKSVKTTRQRKRANSAAADKAARSVLQEFSETNRKPEAAQLSSGVKTRRLASTLLTDTLQRNDNTSIRWYTTPEPLYHKTNFRSQQNQGSRVHSAPSARQHVMGTQRVPSPKMSQISPLSSQKTLTSLHSPKLQQPHRQHNASPISISNDQRSSPHSIVPVATNRITHVIGSRINSAPAARYMRQVQDCSPFLMTRTLFSEEPIQTRPLFQTTPSSAPPHQRSKIQGGPLSTAQRIQQPQVGCRSPTVASQGNVTSGISHPGPKPTYGSQQIPKGPTTSLPLYVQQSSEPILRHHSPLRSQLYSQEPQPVATTAAFTQRHRSPNAFHQSSQSTDSHLQNANSNIATSQRGLTYQYPWGNFITPMDTGVRSTLSPTQMPSKAFPRRQIFVNQMVEMKTPVKRQHTPTLPIIGGRLNPGMHSHNVHQSLMQGISVQPQHQTQFAGKMPGKIFNASLHQETEDGRRGDDLPTSANPAKRLRHFMKIIH